VLHGVLAPRCRLRPHQPLDGGCGHRRGVSFSGMSRLSPFPPLPKTDGEQLWQWAKNNVTAAEGKKVTKEHNLQVLKEVTADLASKAPKGNRFSIAARYLAGQITGEDYADFLTTLLYNEITTVGGTAAKL